MTTQSCSTIGVLLSCSMGIDWDGPLATDRDENTVVVDPPL